MVSRCLSRSQEVLMCLLQCVQIARSFVFHQIMSEPLKVGPASRDFPDFVFPGETGEDGGGDGRPGRGDGEASGGHLQQGGAPQARSDQAQHEDTEDQEVRIRNVDTYPLVLMLTDQRMSSLRRRQTAHRLSWWRRSQTFWIRCRLYIYIHT